MKLIHKLNKTREYPKDWDDTEGFRDYGTPNGQRHAKADIKRDCEYQNQAMDFLRKCDTTMIIERLGQDELNGEEWKQERIKFRITIKRDMNQYAFDFWGCSIHAGMTKEAKYRDMDSMLKPHQRSAEAKASNVMPYDVLAGLGHYVEPLFDDFCADFGYGPFESSKDYESAKVTHEACLREQQEIERLFNEEERTLLQDIA